VSPKAGSELRVLKGNELKLVFPQVGAEPARFAGLEFEHFFLQPMDSPSRAENTQRALEYCLAHPRWRLSLQTHKLLTSVIFARTKGYNRPLTAAELEMMNLTGDGTGLDMVTMPQAMREQVPTSNFFVRLGYERNPVAIRNNTVAKLLAVTDRWMDQHSSLPGAQELAAAF